MKTLHEAGPMGEGTPADLEVLGRLEMVMRGAETDGRKGWMGAEDFWKSCFRSQRPGCDSEAVAGS